MINLPTALNSSVTGELYNDDNELLLFSAPHTIHVHLSQSTHLCNIHSIDRIVDNEVKAIPGLKQLKIFQSNVLVEMPILEKKNLIAKSTNSIMLYWLRKYII